MDLKLLDDRLATTEEPHFRARQVWEWAARGVAGYAEMTNLPRALREQLDDAAASRVGECGECVHASLYSTAVMKRKSR